MSTKLFISFPVQDLPKSKEFFTALGYSFNPQFTDERAACLIISEHNYVMLVNRAMFEGFAHGKGVCDAKKANECAISWNVENREEVDEMVKKAIAAGGKPHGPPQDHGFMYQHGYEDLDGHIWEPFYMDPAHVQK